MARVRILLLGVVLAVILGLCVQITVSSRSVVSRVDSLIHYLKERIDTVPSDTVDYTDGDGLVHHIKVPKKDDETYEEWAARVKAAVQAIKDAFP